MITIDFCYQVVTPESAEQGDFSESGFITPGMWKYSTEDYEREQWKIGDLAHFIDFARSLGINSRDGCGWAYSVDPDQNYQTGEDTSYSMHIAGCTDATRERIFRLLTGDTK